MAQASIARRAGRTDRAAAAADPAPDLFVVELVAGTPVMTLQGVMPVEHVLPDDRILTRAGAMRVTTVTAHSLRHPDLMRVSARALGHDRPEEDVLLPADQPIHLRDWRARAMFGTDEATVPVHRLADGIHVRRERPNAARTIRLGLPRAAVIYAGGLELAARTVTVAASVTA